MDLAVPPSPQTVPSIVIDAGGGGGSALAVKLTPPTFAVLTVTGWLTGLKVNPVLLGVTVYDPAASPEKV